jgi:hypothetical protein
MYLQEAVQGGSSQSRDGPALPHNVFQRVLRGGPAGGGYTTVEDLLVFDRALRSGKLVLKQMLDRICRAYPEKRSPTYV